MSAALEMVQDNLDIEIEDEEDEDEMDGEEIVVQGSMQFNLVPKADEVILPVKAGLVEASHLPLVPATSPTMHVEKSRADAHSPVPLEDLVSATLNGPNGSIVYLIGTAHFSKECQAKVKEVISRVKPSVIVLELCSSRVSLLKLDEKTLLEEASNLNASTIKGVMKNLGVVMGAMHCLLLSMSAEITRVTGMAPGGEFRCALAEARRIPHCMVSLGDRPIDITIKRAFYSLSFWRKLKFIFHVVFQSNKITKDDIEKCLEQATFQNVMEELSTSFPELSRVFITERDLYLAHSLQVAVSPEVEVLQEADGTPRVVVGVVGLGHVEGIKNVFGSVRMEEVLAVMTVPKPSRFGRVFRFTLKVGVICLVCYGVNKYVPKPEFMSMEKISPHLQKVTPHVEKVNESIKGLTKIDLMSATRNMGSKLTGALDSSKKLLRTYI